MAKCAGCGKCRCECDAQMNFLKAEQLSAAKWRVLSIPFGGPFDGKDLDEEFFSERTDIKEAWSTGARCHRVLRRCRVRSSGRWPRWPRQPWRSRWRS